MTMNGPNWKELNDVPGDTQSVSASELLSAYHDGELSAEESAQVQQALREHGTASARLAEFSELSSLIGRATTFSDDELRSVGGKTLRERVLSGLAKPPSAAGRRRKWNRWAVAAGSLVASLGLVVILSLPLTRQAPQVAHGPAMVTDSVVLHEGLPGKGVGTGDVRGMPVSRAADHVRRESGSGAAPVVVFAPPAPAAPAPESAVGDTQVTPAFDKLNMRAPALDNPTLPTLSPGRAVDPGELISHLTSLEGEAVLIQYTVVDVRRARGEMEVLLSRHGIQVLESSGAAAAKPMDAESQTVAIYVEAGDDQLAAALNEFKTVPTSVEPLDAAADAKSGSRPANAPRISAKDETKALPDSPLVPQRSRNAKEQSYQVPLTLSQEEAEQIPRRGQLTQNSQRYSDYVRDRRVALPAEKKTDAQSRVLILLQRAEGEKM